MLHSRAVCSESRCLVCPCLPQSDNQDKALTSTCCCKIWKVEHKGSHGDRLRTIKVKAICLSESLAGRLIRINHVYDATILYFHNPTEN